MQELSSVSSVSVQNTTLATHGCSIDSPQTTQAHDHGSLQQHQQFQSENKIAPQTTPANLATAVQLHTALAHDSNSSLMFAATQSSQTASSQNDPQPHTKASILQLSAVSQQSQSATTVLVGGSTFMPISHESSKNTLLHTLYTNDSAHSGGDSKSWLAPQFMTFDKVLSSPSLKISHTGLTVESTDKAQKAITNHSFTEGVVYWEVICPIRCNGILFGVTSQGQTPIIVTQTFHSSTKRVVGVEINIKEGEIRYYINGRYTKKLKSKELKTPGLAWHGYIEFKEAGMSVILNPFCRYPVPLFKSMQMRSKLPETMFFDIAHTQVTLLEQHIGNHMLICAQPPRSESEYAKQIHDLTDPLQIQVQVFSPEADIQKQENTNIILLKFTCRKDLLKFASVAAGSKLAVLDPRNLAKLVHHTKMNNDTYKAAFDLASSEVTKKIQANFSKFIESHLSLPEDNKHQILFGFKKEPSQSQREFLQDMIRLGKYNEVIHQGVQDIQLHCLESGALIVASGYEVKLFKSSQEHTHTDFSTFSNYPVGAHDAVSIKIRSNDLQFLLGNLTISNEPILSPFWTGFIDTYDSQRVQMPYIVALQAVQTLGSDAVKQYQRLEHTGNEVAMHDTSKKDIVTQFEHNDAKLTVTEIHRIMSIVLELEDQLWSMVQDQRVSFEVKQLWPPVMGRVHTAYGRLSSMLQMSDSENPIQLAELGLYNSSDRQKHICFFQEPAVPLESIYENGSMVDMLEKQFVANYLVKGLPTWNVSLEKTLNNLPAKNHSVQEEVAHIDQVLSAGNFAMTCNNAKGTINLWSTQLGLQKAMTHGFCKQANIKEDYKDCKLKHTKFTKVFDQNGVVVLNKRAKGAAAPIKQVPLFSEADLKDQTAEAKSSEQEDGDGYFFGLFVETEEAFKAENFETKSDTSIYSVDGEDTFCYFCEELPFSAAWLSATTIPGPVTTQIKEEAKKEPPKEEKKLDEKQSKIMVELVFMGFPKDLIEQAFATIKKVDMQEVLDEVLKLQSALPPAKIEKTPEPTEDVTWKAYSCAICTFNNFENPAKMCVVCGSEAPDSAKIVTKILKPIDQAAIAKQEQERLAQEEEKKIAQEKQVLQTQKELLQKQAREQALAETNHYFATMQVRQYLLASNMGGKSKKPLLIAAAMAGQGQLDIHFKWARYTKDYMKNFEDFQSAVESKQLAVEAIYPRFKQMHSGLLRVSDIGLARFSLDTVCCICQLNVNIDEKTPLSILVLGTKDGQQVKYLVSVYHSNRIETIQLKNFDVPVSAAFRVDNNTLLVQSNDKLCLYKTEKIDFELVSQTDIAAGDTLIGVSNQLASVRCADKIRTFSLGQQKGLGEQHNSLEQPQTKTISEDQVLKLRIDPGKVAVEDLDKYESLMKGSLSAGQSNASTKKGFKNGNFAKHTWILNSDHQQVGPMELKLQKPTSLLSLNIDISFKCIDSQELMTCLNPNKAGVEMIKTEESELTEPTLGDKTTSQVSQKLHTLGQFSMRGFSDAEQPKLVSNSGQCYLPLVVKRNKGSCYNNNLMPSKMLVDNDLLMFASNYGKPEVIFAHMYHERMLIDKITIRNTISSKTGAYPMGEGMIFMSDTMQPFEQTDTFRNFTLKDYQLWKEERVKDARPLRPNEPVAYFQFDESVQITFEVDFKRASRYIMLKPTGFRQKPNAFNQNADQVPMEIQFFGVSGKSLGDEDMLESVQVNDTAQNLGLDLLNSQYDCEIKILGSNQEIALVKNFKIDQLRIYEQSIGVQSLLTNHKQIASNCSVEGVSLIRITDSNLQMQIISGVSVTVRHSGRTIWTMQHASIQGIEAKVSGDRSSVCLFDCAELPSQYYRSCLLSPNFFNVVNKQIAQIVSDERFNQRLRIRAMFFLRKLMRTDPKLVCKVLQEIDLSKFLNANVFGKDQNMVQKSEELLQAFHQEPNFSQNLYEILVVAIQQLPNKLTPWSGYEALIGMMKWAMPLNMEHTLDILLETTYNQLVKRKIVASQSSETNKYRTRIAANDKIAQQTPYPFDKFFFRSSNAVNASQSKDAQKSSTCLSKRPDLIRQYEQVCQIAKKGCLVNEICLNFCEPVTLNMLKLYFEKSDFQYQFQIEVCEGTKTVYFMNYSAQVFFQLSSTPYSANADQSIDHALTISGLNHLSKLLTIRITYGATASTTDQIKANNAVFPKVVIEAYGQIEDRLIPSAEAKHQKLVQDVGINKKHFGQSLTFLTVATNKQHLYVPELASQDAQPSVTQVVTEESKTTEEPTKSDTTLKLLQDELRRELASNSTEIHELANSIKKNQVGASGESKPEECLEYLVTVACDLTRLVNHISATKTVNMRAHFLKVTDSLPKLCLDLFRHFIVNESGSPRAEMIKFIKECMFSMMTAEEQKAFFFQIIDNFLCTAMADVSQKEILDAIHCLGASHFDLIDYMHNYLGIGSTKPKLTTSPIAMMYSVIHLSLRQLSQIKMPTMPQKLEVQQVDHVCVSFSISEETTDYDLQFKNLFYTSVWVCDNEEGIFSREEQVALLTLLTQCLSELGKVVQLSMLQKISQDKVAVEKLIIDVLCFDNATLQINQQSMLRYVWQRFGSATDPIVNSTQPNCCNKLQTIKEARELKGVQKDLSVHQQNVLFWLVDSQLQQGNSPDKVRSAGHEKLLKLCKGNISMVMKQINYALENYLEQKDRIQKLEKFLADNKADEQSPSDFSLVTLIKSFIQMLFRGQKAEAGADLNHLQQLWTLALRSLRTVSVQQLVEEHLLEQMIQAFLQSSDQIQQTTFAQILKISEMIARDDKNGRFLCNLLFTTLDTFKTDKHLFNSKSENIAFMVCQGWLDILIVGHCSANSKHEKAPEKPLAADQIYACLEASDVSQLITHAADYLVMYLNIGNFEGSTGCHTEVIMRLELASDMLSVALKAKNHTFSKNYFSLQELYAKCQNDVQMKDKLGIAIDRMITWLFLSGRMETDGAELQALAVAQQTPATVLAKTITNSIIKVLELVSDCVANTEVIYLGLSSLTSIVRSMNQSILTRSKSHQISFDMSIKLTKRTNFLFTKLLSNWLVSDTVVNFFVFELRGFEFLLDTISPNEEHTDDSLPVNTQVVREKVKSALAGSDLEQMLFAMDPAVSSVNSVATVAKDPKVELKENFTVSLSELGKQMKLTDTSGLEPFTAFASIDWSVNKKSYKHKIYYKVLKDNRGYLEHEMLFKLPTLSVVREIQIGFVNYGPGETELIIEPISVLVQAGVEQDNLNLVCTLDIVQDSAFYSVSAVVFAKNMQEYQHTQDRKLYSSIAEAVNSKLECLQNFKANFIKFSMRRNVLTCLENSPLANRLNKPIQLAINFISISGYDLTQVKGDYADFIQREQKKTAMEVMSLICSGNFSSALKVIANQKETIEKIKNQFDHLATLVELKSVMIDPTFVSISTHNAEMGDWIIKRFISTKGFEKHAGLCGKIVVCDKQRVGDRLQMVQDCILETLLNICSIKLSQSTHIQSLLPFIDIYIRTVHLVAPDLCEEQAGIFFRVSHKQIFDLISLLNNSTHERQLQSLKLQHFLVLLMCPPKPFHNNAIRPQELAAELLASNSEVADDSKNNMRYLASILAAQHSEIAWSILLNHKDSLNQLIQPAQIPDENTLAWAKFWLNTVCDRKVRARLQEEEIPLKIYEFIKEAKPVEAGRVIKHMSEECLVLLVELILRISAGNTVMESKLAQSVIVDMKLLSTQRDMLFVNKVLLPLIKNEDCLPVCLLDQKVKESWSPNVDTISDLNTEKAPAQNETTNSFVPSSLIEPEHRVTLINAFKEIVGKVSTSQVIQALSSQWVLMHTVTQYQAPVAQFKPLWESLQGKGPVIMLVRGTNKIGKKMLFGGYCSKQMPACPATLDQDVECHVPKSIEDFLFAWVEGQGWFFFKPQETQAIVEFFSDFESGGAISMGNDFILISNSYDFELKVGMIDCLADIKLDSVPTTGDKSCLFESSHGQSSFNVEKAEIWIANLGSKAKTDSSLAKSSLKQHVLNTLSLQQNEQPQHPWAHSLSPYNLFRGRQVFMVPSHILVKQIGEILLQSSEISLTNQQKSLVGTESLQMVFDKFMTDKQVSESAHNILDLHFNIDQLGLGSAELADDDEDVAQRVTRLYAPECGFFEQFEKQGGVKSFIQVTLAQLSFWKDEKSAESWRLWLKEIESFCEIPLFFQLFLKNKNCKDLLFKILSEDPTKDEGAAKLEQQQKEQKEAVEYNYKILAEIFAIPSNINLRDAAIKAGFLPRILERLSAVSGEKPRVVEVLQESEDSDELLDTVPALKREESRKEDGTKKARKGVGYSAKQGETWNVAAYFDNKKSKNEQMKTLIDICCNFFNTTEWQANMEVCYQILESALLPLLENAFRNGSWIDMVKEAPLYHSYLALTRAIAGQTLLARCLAEIDKKYKPVQNQPIYLLLSKLNDLAQIFLSCLNQQNTTSDSASEAPEKLARDVAKTYLIVNQAVEALLKDKRNDNEIGDALALPVPEQYRILLQKQRFEYMDMKVDATNYKHHYKSSLAQNQSPPQSKIIRLAQELTDLSYALPSEHTNAIFVRVDKSRVDLMKALITGATGTPYAHGCYEFDIFCENGYPSGPPKMNLCTTGAGQIRFNPNLYACGKVCLSLLNTWRGSATENWDPKLSTILQVLVSVQAIIMSEEVYFNEPGFEQEAGTTEGEKKNEGYMNIVRYGNVKYAMLGQIKSPSKGFESVIKRHFYIKREEILIDVKKWVERADKVEALFTGLVSDHNHAMAKDFQKSKTKYREMLAAVVVELEDELNKLEKPTNYQIKPKLEDKRRKLEVKKIKIDEGQQNLEEVDMDTDEETLQIDTNMKNQDINVDDEAVKDRWSRYIGAMGVEAVTKQAAANIFLSGAGALGIEISKNLVLSGCKSFTMHDSKPITIRDLSGQFFLSASDKTQTRVEACLPRIQQLNFYVKCKMAPLFEIPDTEEDLEKAPWCFQDYQVVILTESNYSTAKLVSEYCHKKGKKFICADAYGVFGRVFNDFGDAFEVLDKNGEELQDCMIKSISNEEKALVELLQNAKHKFEDGDEVLFTSVEGMDLKEGSLHLGIQNADCKSSNINDTIHKVTVVNPYAFRIGDTRGYTDFKNNGIAKQLRTKLTIKFLPFGEVMQAKEIPQDMNMSMADFEKMANNPLSHVAFEALDNFKTVEKRMPKPWDLKDAEKFLVHAKAISSRFELNPSEWKSDGLELKLLHLFSFQCQGVFNPICAFFGGYVAQEAVKAITGKFTPTSQLFYYDAMEVLPSFDPSKDIATFEEYAAKLGVKETNHRSDGLRICLGEDILEKLMYTRLFMVGAGAIGCELLKNYAMLGIGTGKEVKGTKQAGQIVLTDPDVIEVSNLNRQFLFREKHLRKPKSQTAAAAAIYMNPDLKGNVIARLDKVHEGSANIFTDKFFEDLTIVTNALDNVQARKYIDIRCVTAKTPLLESGTLGPKGHVQVILPFKTESYGQQQDPEDNNEIPICTMKMFPEETLHCVEWARDQFGNLFSQKAQSTQKLVEEGSKFEPTSQQDFQMLKEGFKMLKKRPKNFMDCIEDARKKFEKAFNHDIRQLLHVYPLDAKTKEGSPFWSLPKRPPVPIDFDKSNMLHCTFITSMACLRARIFFIEIPSKTPRSEDFRKECGELASAIKLAAFVPNDEKAKEIQASVDKAAKSKEEQKEEEKKEEEKVEETKDVDQTQQMCSEFKKLLSEIPFDSKKQVDQYFIKPEVFEKDNDSNFHIDFMYSMANCRSANYKLDPMDWINVKLKAGRIVPALATTTAAIAGLQALELIKVLKDLKTDQFRNVFLNLAVPSMTASEPGPVMKVKLLEGLEVSLWDRWDIKDFKESSLRSLLEQIETTYNGLEVRDIMRGNAPIYFHAIMNAPGKEADKKATLDTSLKKIAECDSDELYVDLTITCVRKDDSEQKILAGVPSVRVFF